MVVMKETLELAQQSLATSRVAKSLMNEDHLDSKTISLHAQEEAIARQDDAYAHQIKGGGYHSIRIDSNTVEINKAALFGLVVHMSIIQITSLHPRKPRKPATQLTCN